MSAGAELAAASPPDKRGDVSMMTRHQASNSLIRGLNVINQALAAHHDQRPWKQILEASHKEFTKAPLVIVIEDGCSESVMKETFFV